MGAYQSKLPAEAPERTLIDKLRALQVEKDGLDSGYVVVSSQKTTAEAAAAFKSLEPTDISVSLMVKWQDALLRDPKNR